MQTKAIFQYFSSLLIRFIITSWHNWHFENRHDLDMTQNKMSLLPLCYTV